MSVFIGVDIGGTNIKLAAVSPRGLVRTRGLIETNAADGPQQAFRRIWEAIPVLARSTRIDAVGIGCAGLVDPASGRLVSSPNLKAWQGKPILRIAQRVFGVYTTIDNDATAAAWGEYRCGANRGTANLVFITLGTGVGGGIVANGELVRGTGGFGGEIGHITVDAGGRRCRCGNRGCLEAYAGSYAMVAAARARLREQPGRSLGGPGKLSADKIFEAARDGSALARSVVRDAGEHLGIAIASLVNLLNPEVVVIGGGISASFDLLYPHIDKMVRRRAFSRPAEMVRIERSTLGNDATAVGAAMFARDRLRKNP